MKLTSIFVLLFLTGARAQQPRLRLLDEVSVEKESITLADLLPTEANPPSVAAAEVIFLGRAPEPGSFRVFTADKLKASIPSDMLIDCPARVVVRRAGWPINPSTLKRALEGARVGEGPDVSRGRIVFPAGVATRTPNSELEVVSMNRSSKSRTLIAQVQCRERSVCGRFVVQITLPEEPTLTNTERPRYQASLRTAQLAATPPNPRTSALFLVQAGRRALLVTESNNLRITEPVSPLKRGRAGEIVRVMNPATHRMLLAEVVGADLLRPAAVRTVTVLQGRK